MTAPWKVRDRFVGFETRWFTLLGEHLETDAGEVLEYWRVERADSVIVLPLRDEELVLPAPMYRPGIGQMTLDFPGGRIPTDTSLTTAATHVLTRELGIADSAIASLQLMNPSGWPVNSSFSNQRLFGAIATLRPDTPLPQGTQRFTATAAGVARLSQQLQCLQCRAVLWEWWGQHWATRP